MTADELIELLKTSTKDTKLLDQEITAFFQDATPERQSDGRTAQHRDGMWVSIGKIEPWTADINAALTLLPEDAIWCLSKWRSSSGDGPIVYWFDLHLQSESFTERHPVAAVAVCIAAINAKRARTR